jgi:hypothetical protein
MKIASFCYENEGGWVETLNSYADFDSPQTLIIIFGDSSYSDKPQLIQQISKTYPNSKIIGCSTAGEVLGQTITEKSLVGAIIKFEKTEISLSYSGIENSKDSFAAGENLAKALNRKDLRGVLILSDGLNINGSKLIEGINSVLPSSVVVTGGLAGDDGRFSHTWVIKNGVAEDKVVSAVGFYGENVTIGHGSKGGWDIFGPERRVTKSIDNELFELDGKPALQLYKDYLGDRAADLPASALLFPLALRTVESDQKQIVRTILSINEEKQSMTFAGDVPENSLVQLMRANFDRLIDGASEAAIMTRQNVDSVENVFSIAISCVGRRLILGERAEEELEAVMDYLPRNTTQIGFYSYGEISPYASGHCDLHNQTMTLTTFTEN